MLEHTKIELSVKPFDALANSRGPVLEDIAPEAVFSDIERGFQEFQFGSDLLNHWEA